LRVDLGGVGVRIGLFGGGVFAQQVFAF